MKPYGNVFFSTDIHPHERNLTHVNSHCSLLLPSGFPRTRRTWVVAFRDDREAWSTALQRWWKAHKACESQAPSACEGLVEFSRLGDAKPPPRLSPCKNHSWRSRADVKVGLCETKSGQIPLGSLAVGPSQGSRMMPWDGSEVSKDWQGEVVVVVSSPKRLGWRNWR